MPELPPAGVTPGQVGAIADAIVNGIITVTTELALAIKAVQDDQAETREQLYALTQRVETLERSGRVPRRERH
jgi:hypothetical protein